jgi:phenylpyruvate tautomerase PptA (4-oxalocrotonate tautomerase family)
MEKKLELVGTVEFRDGSVVKIFRQYDPVLGFQYFLEEGGELSPFDAFGEREYRFRMPYPVMLDEWIDRMSAGLKVYQIEDDDWDAEIGGQKIREWCEKALQRYESDEVEFWKEYWGLLKDERETLFYFFEKFLREKKNISKKDWREWWEFRRTILHASLGEYRDKLVDHFIHHLSYALERGLEAPRNKARSILVWLNEHEANNWGWSLTSIMDTWLGGLYEWDYMTAEERKEMASAIYERLEELAEEEEDWAGRSAEEWLDLLKKELIARKEIRDTDKWVLDLWKNWLRYYIDRLKPYEILDIVFKGNPDWDWMPRKEKMELAEEVIDLIKDKLEAERTA